MGRGGSLLFAVLLPALASRASTALAEPRPADHAPLARREFQVQHQNPESLARIVRNFGSGHDGTFVDFDKRRRIVSARDHAAELQTIAGLLGRLDVPAPVSPHVDLDVRVLLTTRDAGDALDPSLSRALAPLRAQLRARAFVEVIAIRDRVVDGEGVKREAESLEGPARGVRCRLKLESVHLMRGAGKAPARVGVDRLRLSTEGGPLGEAELTTAITARAGELVAVGAVPVRGGSLVVVLRATEARP
jgi:hypothetical protein